MDDLDHPLLGHPGAIGRSGCGGGRPQSPPAGPWRGYFEPVQEAPCCAGCDGLPPGWRGVMRASRLPAPVFG